MLTYQEAWYLAVDWYSTQLHVCTVNNRLEDDVSTAYYYRTIIMTSCDITPFNKIDKLLVVYRFCNVM